MTLEQKILALITADENRAEVKTVSLTAIKSGGAYITIETKPVEQPEPLTQEQLGKEKWEGMDNYEQPAPTDYHNEEIANAADESSRSANRAD